MNKPLSVILALLFIIFSSTTLWLWQRVQNLEENISNQSVQTETPALHILMGYMQKYMHKLTYAAENEEGELADFYLHELEELSGDIIQFIPEYDGFPVGELTSVMLLPVLEETEEILKEEDWDRIKEQTSVIVRACNTCHSSTDHSFIRITEKAEQNPFNQEFNTP